MGDADRVRLKLAAVAAFCSLAALMLLSVACGASGSDDIILITIDTQRADRLGCYGNGNGLTPNIDRLADRGVTFDDATAPTPITLPSHASLLTGRYPTRTGVRNNGTFVLPESETSLAEILAGAGWSTAAVLAAYPLHQRYGLAQGFAAYDDRFMTLPADRQAASRHFPERIASTITDLAIAQWRRMESGPRFLWVHYFDPHAPYDAPAPFGGGDTPAERYDGEVAYVDREIGRLLDTIAAGRSRPVVVLTSDHGEGLDEHDEQTHGLFLYQTTMQVPLVISAPGRLPAGTRVAEPVSLVDVMPTLLGLFGLALPGDLDGADLGELIGGGAAPSRPVYGETFLPRYDYGFSDLRMIRRGPLKFIDAPGPELYDLSLDPGELRDLAGGHPDQARLSEDLALYVEAEDPDAAARAVGALDAEAIANLQSLGYVAAGSTGGGDRGERGRDPKAMTDFIRRYDRAQSLVTRGEVDEGIAIFRELQAVTPENPMIPFQIGVGLLMGGRLRDAETELLDVVERDPSFTTAHLMLAEVQSRLGKTDDAERSCKAAMVTAPWWAEPHYRLGLAREAAGRFRPAGEAFVEAVRLEADNQEYIDALISLRAGRGDLEQAAKDLDGLLADAPEAAGLWTARGRVHGMAGDTAAAAAAFERALSLRPGDARTVVLLGDVLLAQERFDAAEQRFRLVLEEDPDARDARFGLARALAVQGRVAEADAEIDALLERYPRFAPAFTLRGRLLEAQGQLDAARSMYRQALTLDRTNRAAYEGLQRLRSP